MRNLLFMMCLAIFAGGCTGMTSPAAEQVTLYRDESAIPEPCEILGEVTAGVSANTTPYPVEVMEKYLRERAFNGYGADVVWLYNTMISGVEVVGYGIAYKCI